MAGIQELRDFAVMAFAHGPSATEDRFFPALAEHALRWTDAAKRASVGSTEASNGRLARFGRIDRSHLRPIRFGVVGSGALRTESGVASLLR